MLAFMFQGHLGRSTPFIFSFKGKSGTGLSKFQKFHKFSRNISWPVDMNMQMSELMMSSPHNVLFILYTEMTKHSHISAMSMLGLP